MLLTLEECYKGLEENEWWYKLSSDENYYNYNRYIVKKQFLLKRIKELLLLR